jgi:hypothetical protein
VDLISVIFPSRGRPAQLAQSVAGLLDLAAVPDAVEVLVALEPDDPAPPGAYLQIPATFSVTPERFGYKRINEYFNTLADLAAGEWMMLWNDDCSMLTPGWDKVIRAEGPGILWPQADYAPDLATFPVIPSAWVRHLGHLSLDQSVDMWIHHVGRDTGTLRKIPVSIHHAHVTGDLTAAERDAVASVATFWTPAMVQARAADAVKLRALLEGVR